MIRGKGRPLRSVLLTAIGGVAVGAVVVTAILTIGLLRLTSERTALAEMRRDAVLIQRRLTRTAPNRQIVPPCRVLPALGIPEVCFVPAGGALPEASGIEGAEGAGFVGGERVLYVAQPILQRGRSGTLYVFRPSERVAGRPVAGRILLAAAAALGVAAVVAYALAGRIARPLHQLAAAARSIARGESPRPEVAPGAPTEVAQLHTALDDLSRDLSSARDRERSFLMSVSHELRTPLTAIRGYGEALADGTARGASRAGDVIVNESRRLERLVQDLLDLARLQAGEFSVATEESDLARLARGVVEAHRHRASDAGVRLELSAAGDSSCTTDPDRAQQMLANLVENALRVTPSGARVRLTVDGTSVEVSDDGPGLEPGDIAHAFDRFYLWERYRGERPVGTGLGLAIVGQLARLLGVTIDTTSEAGRGTTFRLAFPR